MAKYVPNYIAPGLVLHYKIDKTVYEGKSKYQKIQIIEHQVFGRMLVLDDDPQIAESDAYLYDQAITAPMKKRKFKRVLILGGSDGGVLREVLTYPVKEAVLVDIDEKAVNVCKKYLKGVHKGAFSDKRARVVIQDGLEFLKANKGFDLIIVDFTFPPLGMSEEDYLIKFFKLVHNALNNGGALSFQCCSVYIKEERIKKVKKFLKPFFKEFKVIDLWIPSYCEPWVFVSAKKK